MGVFFSGRNSCEANNFCIFSKTLYNATLAKSLFMLSGLRIYGTFYFVFLGIRSNNYVGFLFLRNFCLIHVIVVQL